MHKGGGRGGGASTPRWLGPDRHMPRLQGIIVIPSRFFFLVPFSLRARALLQTGGLSERARRVEKSAEALTFKPGGCGA